MATDAPRPTKRLLDPIDRFSEALFGLIMVLSFTGSLSAAESGREEVRTMLIGAIGCNLAWGIVDAAMYLIARLGEQGRSIQALRKVREATDAGQARAIISDAMPPLIASTLKPSELDSVRARLISLTDLPRRPRLSKDDLLAAVAVFLWVFAVTFPVVIPFVFMRDAVPALRVSNAIAIGMLFLVGYSLGRVMGSRPWVVGLAMVIVGGVLVGITIALGG